jgi:hypothetical protein
MNGFLRLSALLLLCLIPLTAQLTPSQREEDFRQLATVLWKQYGPYEWKRELFRFDLMDLSPWLERVRSSRNDLEYLETCFRYVHSLNDGHVTITFPSSFVTSMPIDVDLYDGRLLVERVNTQAFPPAQFPLAIGDEVIAIDGRPALDILRQDLMPFQGFAFERQKLRFAASTLFLRLQSRLPRAAETPARSLVALRRPDGTEYSVTLNWTRQGLALSTLGLLPEFPLAKPASGYPSTGYPANDYMDGLLRLGYAGVPAPLVAATPSLMAEDRPQGLLGFGQSNPYYTLPAGFERRTTTNFFTGTFSSGGRRLGLLRIGTMAPPQGLVAAYAEIDREIRWLQENTDGLIVDVSRNNGGFVIYVNELIRRLTREPFESVGFEMRASASRLAAISAEFDNARVQGAPAWVLASYEALIRGMQQAFLENRGRTGPIPLNAPTLTVQPATDNGVPYGYSKPLIVVTDEFSVSGGDMFAATIQDMGRGKLVGFRTGGLGAVVNPGGGGGWSETSLNLSTGLMVRSRTVSIEGYPSTNYIENVGVHPDIELDYMTRSNLLSGGRLWLDRLIEIALAEVNAGPQ